VIRSSPVRGHMVGWMKEKCLPRCGSSALNMNLVVCGIFPGRATSQIPILGSRHSSRKAATFQVPTHSKKCSMCKALVQEKAARRQARVGLLARLGSKHVMYSCCRGKPNKYR
jgi:hypothetical protein